MGGNRPTVDEEEVTGYRHVCRSSCRHEQRAEMHDTDRGAEEGGRLQCRKRTCHDQALSQPHAWIVTVESSDLVHPSPRFPSLRGVLWIFYKLSSRVNRATLAAAINKATTCRWNVGLCGTWCKRDQGSTCLLKKNAVVETHRFAKALVAGSTMSSRCRQVAVSPPIEHYVVGHFSGLLTVIRPCTVRFFQIENPMVRFGAVLRNRTSYGAVRCGFRIL